MKTGNGLSEYARVHLGTPYFYGALKKMLFFII